MDEETKQELKDYVSSVMSSVYENDTPLMALYQISLDTTTLKERLRL